MVLKEVIQPEKEIEVSLDQICDQLLARHPQLNHLVLVGIRTGGVFLAERLR
jgi:pyrimidine operon attenuation protein/uracil phosphoribosyltransferase